MKKKFSLAFTLVILFICIFAITVSAENRTSISYTDINGVTHNVPVVKYDDATAQSVATILKNDATVQARFVDNGAYSIIKASDGSLTAYPTWYLIEPSGNNASYVAISEIEYAYVNAKSGKTYDRGAIVYIEFPEGMNYTRNNSVFGKKNGSNPYETNVTDIYLPSTLVAFESECFAAMPYLKNVYIEAGNSVTSIPSGTFSNSTVEYIQFENLTELETLDGVTNTKLKGDIDLSKTKLKTIKSSAFAQCKNMGKITLPDTVEVIENSAFENTGNAYLSSPYLPANLKSVGKRFFAYNNNLLDTYIFPAGVTSIGDEPFQDSKVSGDPAGKKLNLVFLGEVTGVVYLNGNGHQKHAEEVTVYFANNTKEQYNQNGFYVKPSGSSYTDVERAIRVVFCKGDKVTDLIYLTNVNGSQWQNGTFIMEGHTHFGEATVVPNNCGYDGSETVSCIICDTDIVSVLEATNNHNYVDGVCADCGKTFCPGGGNHDMKQVILFENGFMSDGKIINKCQFDGCTYEVKESDVAPIFTLVGYSSKIDGDKITVSYLVCQESLKIYEEVSKTKLQFGAVASKANATPISVNSGVLSCENNVVMASVDNDYTAFDFILNGFTEKHYATPLVICAYVYDGKEVNYLCINDNNEVGQFANAYTITFNSFAQ